MATLLLSAREIACNVCDAASSCYSNNFLSFISRFSHPDSPESPTSSMRIRTRCLTTFIILISVTIKMGVARRR